jgi:hypothetical protein|tara:strand:- start:106 stop:525 length:420 start_codon:yes stop_codon:yes gene_type:complete
VVVAVEMKIQQQQLFKEQMEGLVVAEPLVDQLQKQVVQETLLPLVLLKEIMVVQVMVNQEFLELVVAVVELVELVETQQFQEIRQEMVEQDQQTILQVLVLLTLVAEVVEFVLEHKAQVDLVVEVMVVNVDLVLQGLEP